MWTAEDHRRNQRVFLDKYESKLAQARRHFNKCPDCKPEPCQTWYNLHDKAEDYKKRADSSASAAYRLEKQSERESRARPTEV